MKTQKNKIIRTVMNISIVLLFIITLFSCTESQEIPQPWTIQTIDSIVVYEKVGTEWVENECPSSIVNTQTSVEMRMVEPMDFTDRTVSYSKDNVFRLVHNVKTSHHQLKPDEEIVPLVTITYSKQ